MMRKTAISFLALLTILLAEGVAALGLGNIEVRSALNEPLDARVPLRSVQGGDIAGMSVALGSPEQFARAGIERPFVLTALKFEPVARGSKSYIKLTTREPVTEPFLNFLVEVNWPKGRAIREYTVLLDPPVYGAAITSTVQQTVATIDQAPNRAVGSAPSRQRATTRPITQSSRSSTVGRSSAAVGPRSFSPSSGSHTVQRRETLWSIADQYRPDSTVSIQRMMLAILRANPDAFAIDNVNTLKAGAVLRIPSGAEVSGDDEGTVLAEVRRQYAAWEEYRQTFSAAVPKAAVGTAVATAGARPPASSGDDSSDGSNVASAATGNDGRLELAAVGTGTQGTGGSGDNDSALREELTLALEDVDSKRRENAELNERLQEAEDLINDLQRLVELKDDDISALQRQLAEQRDSGRRTPKPACGGGHDRNT